MDLFDLIGRLQPSCLVGGPIRQTQATFGFGGLDQFGQTLSHSNL